MPDKDLKQKFHYWNEGHEWICIYKDTISEKVHVLYLLYICHTYNIWFVYNTNVI